MTDFARIAFFLGAVTVSAIVFTFSAQVRQEKNELRKLQKHFYKNYTCLAWAEKKGK